RWRLSLVRRFGPGSGPRRDRRAQCSAATRRRWLAAARGPAGPLAGSPARGLSGRSARGGAAARTVAGPAGAGGGRARGGGGRARVGVAGKGTSGTAAVVSSALATRTSALGGGWNVLRAGAAVCGALDCAGGSGVLAAGAVARVASP